MSRDEGEDHVVLEQSSSRLKAKNNNLYYVEAEIKEKIPYLTLVCRCT